MNSDEAPQSAEHAPNVGRAIAIIIGVALVAIGVVALYVRAQTRVNHTALAERPKPVGVVIAQAGTYRPIRSYVGTTDPWNAAKVGPQYISAYVATVLVRPGAVVKRGQVLATLDCRNASASSKEIAARAKALAEKQLAAEHEASRVKEMAEGNFASKNEAEQLQAKAASEAADVESLKAAMQTRSLEVDDCILRAPFNGEVADRFADPGAFVRPGAPIVTVIDRSVVRIAADAPEEDFNAVKPGATVAIRVDAIDKQLTAGVSRRAPAADDATRTVHFEIDVPNVDPVTHAPIIPAGTTARLTIEVGDARPATLVPLRAATLRNEKAQVFVVDGGKAKRETLAVYGERAGTLYLDAKLAPGSAVVLEGRSLLEDGDAVEAKESQ